ncbi:MAG TPA: 23S rRNA (adenine(2030)-N(6))-methyltransferase RlmJ [Steroidobacteraceae bacterium]|nr:23S rRNA (adenine(2030)-N(6))-methyltransferase RlmJ [Steroidobacteraceae bacterium]
MHKHIALLQLIHSLQKKAKGFLFLDTHAGAGLYDLSGADARHSGESQHGIARLQQAVAAGGSSPHGAIADYLARIERIRGVGGSRHLYPGSPLLAAAALRPVDVCIAVESQAQVSRALQRAFDQHAALLELSPRVENGDGYAAIRRLLPPALRRGLVLIDPPYESADEERHIAAALADGLERFESGVFALWYPIKRQHEADLFTARLLRGVSRPAVALELCVNPADHSAGLNGSGLLVVNPPWQFDGEAQDWQPQLLQWLGGTGGAAVKWLIHE